MRELSKKNPWYLPQHRYLEIKNFALQYDDWKREVNAIDILERHSKDPVYDAVERREIYLRNMKMVEDAAAGTDDVLGYYIFLTATKECTYNNLRLVHNIPCSQGVYYDHLRKFYYILSSLRQ